MLTLTTTVAKNAQRNAQGMVPMEHYIYQPSEL